MRKVVLSSSDVSVLASMGIVVLCALALFLSGYTIQQRTLRDLRQAIRPRESRPSPRAHLPDYFRTAAEELDDGGAVVMIESEADEETEDIGKMVAEAARAAQMPPLQDDEEEEENGEKKEKEETRPPRDKSVASKEQLALVEHLKAQVAAKSWGVEHPDPLSKSRIPVTRAERRRLIKAEIKRLAQSEKPVYYQRRLW